MTRFAALLPLWLGLAALACTQHTQGEPPHGDPTQDESWLGGELPPGNGGLPSGEPAGADDGDWGEAPFALWFGELELPAEGGGAASGGFVAVNAVNAVDMENGDSYEACVATWTSTIVATPIDMDTGCSGCEFVVELEYGVAEVELDLDCAGWGFDPASVEATHIVVGYGGGETLYQRDDNGEWFEHGYAELASGTFYFEFEFQD